MIKKLSIKDIFSNRKDYSGSSCKIGLMIQDVFKLKDTSLFNCRRCPFNITEFSCYEDMNVLSLNEIKKLLVKRFPSEFLASKED